MYELFPDWRSEGNCLYCVLPGSTESNWFGLSISLNRWMSHISDVQQTLWAVYGLHGAGMAQSVLFWLGYGVDGLGFVNRQKQKWKKSTHTGSRAPKLRVRWGKVSFRRVKGRGTKLADHLEPRVRASRTVSPLPFHIFMVWTRRTVYFFMIYVGTYMYGLMWTNIYCGILWLTIEVPGNLQ
jgi:hypothetical protein